MKIIRKKSNNLLSLLLTCLACMLQILPLSVSATIVFVPDYVEDFNSDTDPSVAGFADSVFVHVTDSSAVTGLTGTNPFSGILPLAGETQIGLLMNGGFGPEPGHTITFDLAQGERVTRAAIWHRRGLADNKLTWVGTLGTSVFLPDLTHPTGVITAFSADLSTSDLRDGFFVSPTDIGYLTAVILNGHDSAWDHLMIDTEFSPVPIPPSVWLFATGLLCLTKFTRKNRNHC